MATATVKWFHDAKGIGFITPNNGSEVWRRCDFDPVRQNSLATCMHSKRLFSWKLQMAEMEQPKSARWVKIASA